MEARAPPPDVRQVAATLGLCDGDHAAPECGDKNCWQRDYFDRIRAARESWTMSERLASAAMSSEESDRETQRIAVRALREIRDMGPSGGMRCTACHWEQSSPDEFTKQQHLPHGGCPIGVAIEALERFE